ncbi:MAG: undecaprenyldiphospho-muramoylpentapeptide beta-N-acetylglucosaminyltransferase [Parcubacteria group bacterium]|jgi:UDP-N-acetylglucosamine--N-acetylmuramyl-(pentapeptide) pyrophosphoryl-undecaprenol N-acetylglucosamine transferase
MKIALIGGGSGGHLMPLIAVARKIKEKVPETIFLYIGPVGKMETEIMNGEGIPSKYIKVGKLRRYFSFQNFTDIFRFAIGFLQSMWILFVEMPDAVFSKGGYASLPVALAAWVYRIPVLIHESDAVPGLANSILGKFANRVAVSYASAEEEFLAAEVVLTGNPLREDINQGEAQKAREAFSLDAEKKIILVLGGSQGARTINNRVLSVLPELLEKYQVIHQTGEANFAEVQHRAGELGYKIGREGYYAMPFIGSEMKDIYAVSDLVISRAGANSIAEIAANQKPAILIPLQDSANDHQRMNAYSLAKVGACIVLDENNLGKHIFLSRIEEIMNDEHLRQKLAKNIQSFYHPDATERIAKGVLEMIK